MRTPSKKGIASPDNQEQTCLGGRLLNAPAGPLENSGLPGGGRPANHMPESKWVAPLALVLIFLLALGLSLLAERRRTRKRGPGDES